ncbi:MAG: SIS domain-containing protein [Candidatus Latescibacterota bacterium]
MNEHETEIKRTLGACRRLLDFLEEGAWLTLVEIAKGLVHSLRNGGTVYVCGNGGSATQATHFAAELIGRYNKTDKPALPVFTLADNNAVVTAVSNDYSFADVFSRQIEGLGRSGDCLVALSTSGNSENVVRACGAAKAKGMKVFSLTGLGGGRMAPLSDSILMFPDADTPRIQEAHLIVLHNICYLIESELFAPSRDMSTELGVEGKLQG